jgi:hypothetical protein
LPGKSSGFRIIKRGTGVAIELAGGEYEEAIINSDSFAHRFIRGSRLYRQASTRARDEDAARFDIIPRHRF